MLSLRLRRQQDRNNSGPGAKIQGTFIFLYICKTGEQHRVHPETEQLFVLNNPITVAVKLIDPLAFF